MLAPYLLGLTALVALPAAITFALALTEYDLIRSPRFLGLDNFRELADDEVFRKSLAQLARIRRVRGPAPAARRARPRAAAPPPLPRRGRGPSAAVLPTVVPDIAYGLLWLWLFNPLYGPINLLLARQRRPGLHGLGPPPPQWLTHANDAQAAIIIMSLFTIGEGFVVLLVTRQGLPGELYELAAVEDATAWAVFRRITLPLMAPVLLLLLLRDTVFSFQVNFVPALVVTDGGPPPYSTTYLPLFVYRTGFEYLRYGYAAAATLTMFALTALIVLLQWRIVRRWRRGFAV